MASSGTQLSRDLYVPREMRKTLASFTSNPKWDYWRGEVTGPGSHGPEGRSRWGPESPRVTTPPSRLSGTSL